MNISPYDKNELKWKKMSLGKMYLMCNLSFFFCLNHFTSVNMEGAELIKMFGLFCWGVICPLLCTVNGPTLLVKVVRAVGNLRGVPVDTTQGLKILVSILFSSYSRMFLMYLTDLYFDLFLSSFLCVQICFVWVVKSAVILFLFIYLTPPHWQMTLSYVEFCQVGLLFQSNSEPFCSQSSSFLHRRWQKETRCVQCPQVGWVQLNNSLKKKIHQNSK